MRKKFFKLSTEALARQRLVEFPDVVVDRNVQLTRYVSMLKKHGSDKIHVAFRP
jgi:hypothetical protein